MDALVNSLKNTVRQIGKCPEPDFDSLPELRFLLEKSEISPTGRRSGRFWSSWLTWLAVLALPTALFWPDLQLYRDSCLLRTPDWLRDLLRTPANCSICRHLTQVPRVSKVEPEVFLRQFVDAGVPVVVSDATDHWSARQTFGFEYFRQLYAGKSHATCQFFRYRSKFASLKDVLNTARLNDQEPWYVGWSNCDGEAAEQLRKHYQRPYFLPRNSESAHTDWIFMGSPSYGAHFHVDDVDYPSWQAQILGTKIWYLYPPPECHYQCPRRFLEVLLKPGDTIIVDTNWWYHKTLVVGNNISVSIGSEFD